MTAPRVQSGLDDRYLLEDGLVHLTGIHALVRLPLDQRRADRRAGRATAVFISGYEGSPLAGYDLELTRQRRLLDEHDVVFRPGVNEELAATAVQGSQLAATAADRRVQGVTGLWYGKSPGLDRASDALRHANLMGTHPAGGALALVGDDPDAKSSTVPGASEQLLADLGLPTLYPADPQDVLDLGLHAIAMSRASGLWTGIKIAADVADGSGTVRVHPDRIAPVAPEPVLAADGEPFAHRVTARMLQPHLAGLERSRNGARLELARRYAAANGLNRLMRSGAGDRIGIVASGKTFLDVRQALRILGLDDAELDRRGVRLLRLGLLYPLEPGIVQRFAAGLREIIVVEEKRSFTEAAVKDLLYGRADAPAVSGKRHPDGTALLRADGQLDPDTIAAGVAARLLAHGDFPSVRHWQETAARPRDTAARRPEARPQRDRTDPQRDRTELPLLARTPYFCSGCPHNSSTKTPEGSLVGAGIGCHAMVLLMDEAQVGSVAGLTQMGGEGAQWIGMAPFVERGHLLQNIGDGTFHHSGSLAVRAAVAAGVNVTYKLLYNSAVAMTGGQQPAGMMPVAGVTRALAAEGVRQIIITTGDPRRYRRQKLPAGVRVWPRDRVVEAQEVLARVPGVTVLIHDQECATELRRKRKRGLAATPAERVMINERVCEGCGDCGRKSNCLSVQPVPTEFGRKTQIDQSSCNMDFSCLEGDCPSFLTVTPRQPRRRTPGRGTQGGAAARRVAPPLDAAAIPAPAAAGPPAARGPHVTRIAGVGGTGVVTLSQILSTAAMLAGRHVRALDQTGLAQKGGAVISDLKIGGPELEVASKAAAGECDLYLGCDLLVAADARNLAAADPARTVAVVSTSEVPTGAMIVDTSASFPPSADITERIRRRARGDGVFLDARRLAETLLGEDQFANILLAGAAFQAGALPLPAEAIEQAVRLNGVKVDANLQAFRRGRQAVADPEALAATVADLSAPASVGRGRPAETNAQAQTLASAVAAPAGSELARIVALRAADLIAYQDARYARRYVHLVERVRAVEAERVPAASELAEAVARYLYKLMAYKDEYEVARLSLDAAVTAQARSRFGAGARVSYRLHPPVLRALGVRKKITLGPWFAPVFGVLVRMRRLRGTRLDPFGHTRVRRAERQLIAEYTQLIGDLLAGLGAGNHARAVELASLPDEVRGYEQVKLDNVARYRERMTALRAEFAGQARVTARES